MVLMDAGDDENWCYMLIIAANPISTIPQVVRLARLVLCWANRAPGNLAASMM